MELRSWLLYLLRHSKFKFCILIDGLDEVEDGQLMLLETIELLASDFANVKILISSRPERLFESHLGIGYHSIRLQDVNRHDIMSNCQRRLEGTRAASFAGSIAERAEGVFLWAHTVAKDLRKASEHGDGEADLRLRLDQCPTGMIQLFEHLLQRQDKHYVRNPKPCLRLIDFALTKKMDPTLFGVLIASQPQEDFPPIRPGQAWDAFVSTMDSDAANFDTNVVFRCAGLVEVCPPSGGFGFIPEHDPHANLVRLDHTKVRFIHRSVQDFLLETSGATSSLLPRALPNDEAASRFLGAELFRSLIKLSDGFYTQRLLKFASMISKGGWTPRETEQMDLWFAELYTRITRPKKPQSNGLWSSNSLPDVEEPEVASPHLSRKDNLIFGSLALYELEAYYNDKTRGLNTDRLMTILVMMSCNPLWNWKDSSLETYSPFTAQQLQPMLKMSLKYNSIAHAPPILSTCCVWEHLEIARLGTHARSFGKGARKISVPRLSMEAIEDDQEFRTNGLMIGQNGEVSPLTLLPIPDDWCDEKVQQWDLNLVVFEFSLVLRASQLGPREQPPVPQFLRWKIAGTTRFLELSSEQSHALNAARRGPYVRDRAEYWYMENVVAAWNKLLPGVPPQETAQMLYYHVDRISKWSVIYRDGMVLLVEDDECWEWQLELEENRSKETDPVFVEYLKTKGQAKWPHEEEGEEEGEGEEEEEEKGGKGIGEVQ